MTRKMLGIALLIVFAALLAAPSQAAKGTEPPEERVRDRAISKSAAWRPKSSEAILKKSLNFEETQPWLTAEALMMATFAIGQDEATVAKALSILEKQAKKDPQDPVSEFYRGEVLKWTGEGDAAMVAWRKAADRAQAQIEKSKKNASAQFYLGASLMRLKDSGEAKKALKKAGKFGFDQAMVDYQIGLTFLIEENWEAAKNSFDAVHELDPRYSHLYFYRAIAWDKLGQKAESLVDLDQFVKLAPNSPQAKTALALLAAGR